MIKVYYINYNFMYYCVRILCNYFLTILKKIVIIWLGRKLQTKFYLNQKFR